MNPHVAAGPGVSVPTVAKWRGRFVERRLPGLADEERPGRPPSILPGKVSEVLAATLEEAPKGALDRSQPVLPMMPGIPGRRTHDYACHGTSPFAAFNIADGPVISELHHRLQPAPGAGCFRRPCLRADRQQAELLRPSRRQAGQRDIVLTLRTGPAGSS
jgi:hypothetical protein